MAMENKRVIQLNTERTTLGDDDYTIVDSDTNGTAKYRLSRLKETDTTLSVSGMAADAAATGQAISAEATARGNAVTAEAEARASAVTAEATARQTADTTLQGNITAEATARAAADTAIGEDIDDLKSEIRSDVGYSVVITGPTLTPFEVPSSVTLTFESANGEQLPSAIVYFYNASKVAIQSVPLGPTTGDGFSRTVTLSMSDDVKYAYLNTEYTTGIRIFVTDDGNLLTKVDSIKPKLGLINPVAYGYITSTEDLYAVKSGSIWYFKAYNIRLMRGAEALVTITWSQILSKFANTAYLGTSPDGTPDCLILTSERYLYYNWENGAFDIVASSANIPQRSTLILGVIGEQPYGVMYDYYRTTEDNRARYNAVGKILDASSRYSAKLVNKSTNVGKVCFITDPHWMPNAPSADYSKTNKLMQELEHLYNSSPVDCVVCGGDWLNNGGTKNWAFETLGYINGMTHRFNKFYNVVGNHDTNYIIGTELSFEEVKNAYGADYYSFDEGVAHYVILNTFDDDNPPTAMDSHKWEQIAWLANDINGKTNTVIFMHAPIIKNNDTYEASAFATNVTALCAAFNDRSSVTLNGVTYDFTGANGKVWVIIGGHLHTNVSITSNNIKIHAIANDTTDMLAYLMLFDFDLSTINFVASKSTTVLDFDKTM